ncbi:hypothetical protein AB0952_11875 [Streptomyces caniferus]|uniref:hypothetical protein n=1 Tax=Streptomyces caniferus TaxID=285557 RepID=UPI00345150E4
MAEVVADGGVEGRCVVERVRWMGAGGGGGGTEVLAGAFAVALVGRRGEAVVAVAPLETLVVVFAVVLTGELMVEVVTDVPVRRLGAVLTAIPVGALLVVPVEETVGGLVIA